MKKFMHKKGFTLTELSLAMAFLSVILLTIAALIIFTTSIFQKGLAIKSVNNVGQDIIENLTRSITSSSKMELSKFCEGISIKDCENIDSDSDEYFRPISYQQTAELTIGKSTGTYPVNGAFCTGTYSYIYNTGYILGSNYTLSNGSNKEDYIATYGDYTPRLIRIVDSGAAICKAGLKNASESNNNKYNQISNVNFKYEVIGSGNYEELIQETDNSLAIYDFKVFKPDYDKYSGQSFFLGTFILATIKGDVDINVSGDFCKAPVDYSLSSDFSYCAINKFNFASRATGRSES